MTRLTGVPSDLLQAALSGLEMQRQRIHVHIEELRRLLGVRRESAEESESTKPARRKRRVSAAARARMAEGQRRRWAAAKGMHPSEPAKPATKKRRISAEARKRMAEGARKRWAAKKAAAR